MQLIPHLVGQVLLLFVQVWWSWWHSLQAVILIWEWTQLICAFTNWDVGRHTPRHPSNSVLRMWHIRTTIKRFQHFQRIIICFAASALMHNACTTYHLTKAKVFLPLRLTLLLSQQKFAQKPPVPKRTKTLSSYALFSSRKQRRKMHTLRSSRSTT